MTMSYPAVPQSRRRVLARAVSLVSLLPFAAVAQEPQPDPSKLEEVVVTAQYRSESMQDVPVSMAAVGGDKLLESGLNRIEDLAAEVPNLKMSETGIGTNLYVRGIGSGINQGFEQSVGMYVDGVYHGRAQLARAPFLDLERVEVLRGPQNILYGKNSIAGAISMVTAKPTDQYEGLISVLYEPDQDERVFDGVFSGPITDTLGVRIAFRDRQTDGYVENLTLDRDEPTRDEQTARITFAWQPTDAFDATFKYEHGKFDTVGRQIEIINDQASTSANPLFAGRTEAQILDLTAIPPSTVLWNAHSSVLNNKTDYKRSSNGDYSNNDTDNATLTLNWQMAGHTLTSITSFLGYKYDELCDCDFTASPLFNVNSKEDYEQYSQEFRIVSPKGLTFEAIAGAYYQTSNLDFRDRFAVPTGSPVPTILSQAVPGALAATTFALFTDLAAPRTFTQDTDLWSVFGQLTWNLRDDLRLIAGGRYTSEDKDGYRNLQFVDGVSGATLGLIDQIILAQTLRAESNVQSDSRSESNFAPQIAVQFDLSPDIMLYASATKGYKSGGYDARSNASPGGPTYALAPAPGVTASCATSTVNPALGRCLDGAFEYDKEEATGVEIGAKAVVADGAGEVNVAAFRTDYQDLQVSIYDGILGFNVGNAAEAVSQGVELDSRWLVTHGLILSASLAWLDFEFEKFPNGQCVQGQAPTTPGTANCDYKGKSNQYVAEWSGNLGADYTLSLTDALDLRTTLDLIYSSDYSPTQNLDSRVQQDSYVKVNARIALVGNGAQWELALVGKNLTDEKVVSYANDAPLAYNFFTTVAHYGIIEPPRTVAVQGMYRF